MNEPIDLLSEYCATLAGVRRLIRQALAAGSADLAQLRSMERDLEWTIEYMTTGYPPQGRSARSISVDPQKVLVRFSKPLHAPTLPAERIRMQILSVLDLLSPQEREAFMMVRGEGLSYGETAAIMGVKKGTVQDYVNRAQAKIAKRRQRAS